MHALTPCGGRPRSTSAPGASSRTVSLASRSALQSQAEQGSLLSTYRLVSMLGVTTPLHVCHAGASGALAEHMPMHTDHHVHGLQTFCIVCSCLLLSCSSAPGWCDTCRQCCGRVLGLTLKPAPGCLAKHSALHAASAPNGSGVSALHGAAVWDNTDPGSKKGRQLHLGSFPHAQPAAMCGSNNPHHLFH